MYIWVIPFNSKSMIRLIFLISSDTAPYLISND